MSWSACRGLGKSTFEGVRFHQQIVHPFALGVCGELWLNVGEYVANFPTRGARFWINPRNMLPIV